MQQPEQVARKENIPDIDASGLDMQHLVQMRLVRFVMEVRFVRFLINGAEKWTFSWGWYFYLNSSIGEEWITTHSRDLLLSNMRKMRSYCLVNFYLDFD